MVSSKTLIFFLDNFFNTNCMSFSSSVVINVTFPDDKQNYIHRIGRVGRADRYKVAVLERHLPVFL